MTLVLELQELSSGDMPALTPAWGSAMAEAASVSLDGHGHPLRCDLAISGDQLLESGLSREPVTDQMRRSWADQEEATEYGATAIAILASKKMLQYSVIERSRKGTGFDYWLGESESDSMGLFQSKARLEISGIYKGSNSTISRRLETKIKQVAKSNSTCLPAVIAIVSFSQPECRLVTR